MKEQTGIGKEDVREREREREGGRMRLRERDDNLTMF
jgi:hypothetical protein